MRYAKRELLRRCERTIIALLSNPKSASKDDAWNLVDELRRVMDAPQSPSRGADFSLRIPGLTAAMRRISTIQGRTDMVERHKQIEQKYLAAPEEERDTFWTDNYTSVQYRRYTAEAAAIFLSGYWHDAYSHYTHPLMTGGTVYHRGKYMTRPLL